MATNFWSTACSSGGPSDRYTRASFPLWYFFIATRKSFSRSEPRFRSSRLRESTSFETWIRHERRSSSSWSLIARSRRCEQIVEKVARFAHAVVSCSIEISFDLQYIRYFLFFPSLFVPSIYVIGTFNRVRDSLIYWFLFCSVQGRCSQRIEWNSETTIWASIGQKGTIFRLGKAAVA